MFKRSWGAIGAASFVLAGVGCGSSHLDGRSDGHDAQVDGPVDAGTAGDAGCISGPPKSNGHACLCGADCVSGFCADGVCCDQACTGVCQTCNAAGSLGTCLPVPAGVAPHEPESCPVSQPSTCGFDGTCDGAGACHNYPLYTVCGPPTCQATAATTMALCDGKGTCQPQPLLFCAPFACNPATGGCFQSCTSDFDCGASRVCNTDGTCGPSHGGALCTSDQDCASGHCAQGICCDTACNGACVACNLSGQIGTCSTVPACGVDGGGAN